MEIEEIKGSFKTYIGEKEYEHFIYTLKTECIKEQKLFFWQEQIWKEFCISKNVSYTNNLGALLKIFGEKDDLNKLRAKNKIVLKKEFKKSLKKSILIVPIIFLYLVYAHIRTGRSVEMIIIEAISGISILILLIKYFLDR